MYITQSLYKVGYCNFSLEADEGRDTGSTHCAQKR